MTLGLKTGVDFRAGSESGEPGGTTPPRIPRSTPHLPGVESHISDRS